MHDMQQGVVAGAKARAEVDATTGSRPPHGRNDGRRDTVFAAAEKAFFDGDPQWAAELTTPLIRLNREDWPARQFKASALRVLGYQQASSSLRGFHLSGARELDGLFDPAGVAQRD